MSIFKHALSIGVVWVMQDYAKCEWPAEWSDCQSLGSERLAVVMDQLNELWLQPLQALLAIASPAQAHPGSSGINTADGPSDSGAVTCASSSSSGSSDDTRNSSEVGTASTNNSWDSSGSGDRSSSSSSYDIVSFSHFLPHQRLLPEKRFLSYPNLSKAVGSAPLAARITAVSPHIHIFGHSHFSWDMSLDGKAACTAVGVLHGASYTS